MADFPTQDGNGRTYDPDSYRAAQGAGGARRSPGARGREPIPVSPNPTGYVPTYAKYADPAAALTGVLPTGATAGAGYYTATSAVHRPGDLSNPNAATQYEKQLQSAVDQNSTPLLNGYFDAFKNGMAGAVKGYGDLVGQDFKQQVGTLLGNLNAIGGLRSGGVQAGVDQAMAQYGRQIGDYASMTANQAAQLAQNENDLDIERQFRGRQYGDAKNAAHKSFIGHLLGGAGAIAGMIPGVGGVVGGILKGIGGIFG